MRNLLGKNFSVSDAECQDLKLSRDLTFGFIAVGSRAQERPEGNLVKGDSAISSSYCYDGITSSPGKTETQRSGSIEYIPVMQRSTLARVALFLAMVERPLSLVAVVTVDEKKF